MTEDSAALIKRSSLSTLAASLSLLTAFLTLVLLGALHIVSPEFDPSWRMISEYANGDYSWLLSIFFVSWGISSLALAYALGSQISERKGKIGLALLIIAGLGELMAAMFDISHSLHSLASFLGIGGTLLAATFISRQLVRAKAWENSRNALLMVVKFMWASLILMAISFIILIVTYTSSGADMTVETTEVTTLPEGVIALVGWANRLVVMSFSLWLAMVSYFFLKIQKNDPSLY